MNIYLDTETVQSKNPEYHHWLLLKHQDEPDKALKSLEESPLSGTHGELAVIGIATGNRLPVSLCRDFTLLEGERFLLLKFAQWLTEIEKDYGNKSLRFVAHNAEFDFHFLRKRAIINSVPLPFWFLNYGRWECTNKLWSSGVFKDSTSLESLCVALRIPIRKTMKGTDVTKIIFGDEEGLQRVASYCRGDVAAVREIWRKIKQFELDQYLKGEY